MVMKKLLLIVILLCSFVLAGCNSQITGYSFKDVTGEGSFVTNETVINETTDNSTNDNATATEVINQSNEVLFKFKNTSYSLVGSKITLKGFLIVNRKGGPVSGASIDIICNNNSQYNVVTDDDGMFSLSFFLSTKSKCKSGDEAWAEFVFKEKTYRSESIILPKITYSGGGGGGGGGGGSSGITFTGLTPPQETCTDGIQNQDETDVDCGGVCTACPVEETCDDGIQNQDEEDIDCGGVCPECETFDEPEETCSDGIQNQDEEDIDCGGVCDECPVEETCSDGILNQDEEDTDCGGVCDECQTFDEPEETCDDGIQNQDEEDIDCGGVCDECQTFGEPEESCTDGIQNQDEEGIDCGGVCPDECGQRIPEEVPEFSTLTALLALVGAGIFCLIKKK